MAGTLQTPPSCNRAGRCALRLHTRPGHFNADILLGHAHDRRGPTPRAQEAKLSAPTTLWRPDPAELQQGERVLSRLADWIAVHFEHFLPAAPHDLPARLMPASELTLTLLALTTPAQRQSANPLTGWAELLARDLAAALDQTAGRIDWSALERPGASARQTARALLIFPLLEWIGAVRFGCVNWLAPLLDQPHGAGLAWYFLRSLLYGQDHDALLRARLAQELRRAADPARRTRAGLSRLADLVLALTLFGQRGPAALGRLQAPLAALLPDLTLWHMQQQDYELGAVLLLCQIYAGCAPLASLGRAAALLRAAVGPDGAIAGCAPHRPDRAGRFEHCYHATLVGLAALAEAQRVALELRYAELRATPPDSLQARAVGEGW